MAEQRASSVLTAPVRGAASVLGRLPGAGTVTRAAEGALDKVGAVSPRGRRMAVYTGAGVLGVAGVVEWPVALTGAAVAWLTQPRPAQPSAGAGGGGEAVEPGAGARPAEPDDEAVVRAATHAGPPAHEGPQRAGGTESPRGGHGGPLGPTARSARATH
ncbi:hypothetical protein [Streptomyces bungoensis]|uniref:hypothetical protein n=1 Tax=Streptomyces bungoensis TaxID=285568 RepID=UPI000A6F0193|nr:hypothetical protein [Streptomyces bungoensis]